MHKTLTLTTAVLLFTAVAHASPPTAREMLAIAREAQVTPAPQTPAELVHDLRAVLHHAGFQVKRAERGIPGSAAFVAHIERIDYQRQGVCPAALKGFDALGDFLSTTLDGWHARHATGSGLWVWRTRSESVTLWYTLLPCQTAAGPQHPARASLVIARYSPPTTVPAGR